MVILNNDDTHIADNDYISRNLAQLECNFISRRAQSTVEGEQQELGTLPITVLPVLSPMPYFFTDFFFSYCLLIINCLFFTTAKSQLSCKTQSFDSFSMCAANCLTLNRCHTQPCTCMHAVQCAKQTCSHCLHPALCVLHLHQDNGLGVHKGEIVIDLLQ